MHIDYSARAGGGGVQSGRLRPPLPHRVGNLSHTGASPKLSLRAACTQQAHRIAQGFRKTNRRGSVTTPRAPTKNRPWALSVCTAQKHHKGFQNKQKASPTTRRNQTTRKPADTTGEAVRITTSKTQTPRAVCTTQHIALGFCQIKRSQQSRDGTQPH